MLFDLGTVTVCRMDAAIDYAAAVSAADNAALREVVEGAAAADEFKDSPGAMERLAKMARAALADIGDATRKTGDDIAWCETQAAQAYLRYGQDERSIHHARELGPLMQRAADVAGERAANAILTEEIDGLQEQVRGLREHRDSTERLNLRLSMDNLALRNALKTAQAALADIGDADREAGDDLEWCERRAAQALPAVRKALGQK
jgi:chromosome segregation ATPase